MSTNVLMTQSTPDPWPEPAENDSEASSLREGLYWILFQAAPSGVFRAAESGKVLEANAELRALLAADPAAELSLTLPSLCVRPEDWDAIQAQLEENGAVRSHRFEARRLDGGTFWAEISLSALRLKGERILIGSLTDVSAWKSREEQLLQRALRDPLTGLPNRLLFNDRIEHGLQRVRRDPSERFGLLYLDLDDFKRINDEHGHAIGDELLVAFARRIQASVRPQDTVARLGGDEFAIMLAEVASPEDATVVAERIHAALARPFAVGAHRLRLSVSIGITLCDAASAVASLLDVADRAMYAVKRHGGGGHRVFVAGQTGAAEQEAEEG